MSFIIKILASTRDFTDLCLYEGSPKDFPDFESSDLHEQIHDVRGIGNCKVNFRLYNPAVVSTYSPKPVEETPIVTEVMRTMEDSERVMKALQAAVANLE